MQDPAFTGRNFIVCSDPHEGPAPVVTLPKTCDNCQLTNEVNAYTYCCNICCNPRPESLPLDKDNAALLVWEDLFFAAYVQLTNWSTTSGNREPLNLEFKVYRLSAIDDGDQTPGPVYDPIKDFAGTGSSTQDREAARIFARGNIKWDGCSNVCFQPTHPNTYEHFCSREQLKRWAIVVDRLFATLALFSPSNAGDLG